MVRAIAVSGLSILCVRPLEIAELPVVVSAAIVMTVLQKKLGYGHKAHHRSGLFF
jgi:hypothetical protein